MVRSSGRGSRRFALAAAVAAAVLAATAAAVPAAAASDSAARRCTRVPDLDYNNGKVTGFHMFICDDGDDQELNVELRRNGVLKKRGKGIVTYVCQGTAVGTWTAAGLSEEFPCS